MQFSSKINQKKAKVMNYSIGYLIIIVHIVYWGFVLELCVNLVECCTSNATDADKYNHAAYSITIAQMHKKQVLK